MKLNINDKLKLLNFAISFGSWVLIICLFYWIGLVKDVNSGVLLVIHLGAFFFSLTTSPVTWIIKGFGIEIGSNAPNHFQVDKTIKYKGRETILIVRDYSHSHSKEEINTILNEQSKS